MKLRGRAPRGAAAEAAHEIARVRGALVGGTSGALAVAAHGWAGGVLPDRSSVALLVLACATIGALATLGDRHKGFATTAGQSVAGQLAAHVTLTVSAEHAHTMLPTLHMSTAHLAAAVFCAAAIGAAERGLARAAGTMRMSFVVPIDGIPVPETAVAPLPRTIVAGMARLLVSSGLGMRAPPSRVVSFFHQ